LAGLLETGDLLAQVMAGEFSLDPGAAAQQIAAVEAAPGNALDIYLLAHLTEGFARRLWRPLLYALRKSAGQQGANSVFTLLLAADTPAWSGADAEQAEELLQTLHALGEELLIACSEAERPGRLGWCYLLDTRDAAGKPLAPASQQRGKTVAQAVIQAHRSAEWITQLHAGLRRTPAYRACSLADVQRQARSQPPAARLSLFNAASLALPLRFQPPISHTVPGLHLSQDPAAGLHSLALARRLLGEIASDPQEARLDSQAPSLRQRWVVDCGLSAAAVRRWLCGGPGSADPGCDPPGLPLDPPGLEDLPVSAWAGRLQDWETWLERRWEGPDSPTLLAEAQARALVERAGGELHARGSLLLQHSPGGARLAGGLAGSARRFLEIEAQRSLAARPRRESGWGRALFTFLTERIWGSAARRSRLLDPKTARQKLERQAAQRAHAAPPWQRLVRLGRRLTILAWSGLALLLLISSLAPSALPVLAALLAGWLASLPLLGLAFLALAACSWLGAALSSALAELLALLEVQRAAEDLAEAVRSGQRRRWGETLHAASQRVYHDLQTQAEALEQIAAAQSAALETAAHLLQEQENKLRRGPDSGRLLSERRLEVKRPAPLIPTLSAAEVRQAARRFLEAADQPLVEAAGETAAGSTPLPAPAAVRLAAALIEFAAAELARRFPPPALLEWTANPFQRQAMQAALSSLCARLSPAWPPGGAAAASPLPAAMYAGVPACAAILGPGGYASGVPRPLLPPASELHARGVIPAGWLNAEAWLSSCPDRLSLAVCLHGVELDRLEAVRGLQKKVAQPAQEVSEVSCFVA
jgi:hypothetical protein